MHKQKGFTLFELVFALAALSTVALALFGVYVAFHFIYKFW
jgi:prepilin-type N-terminal cleavage/methylation domain-containing protein